MPRILLVEDNEMNRDMLSRRLRRKGYEVAIATDGPLGLEAARSMPFELILMDLSLPGIDGWEVTRRLKSDPATRDVPIIALTAHAMAGDRLRAIEAGCDDYDIKPVDFPRLLAKIEGTLQARKLLMPIETISSADPNRSEVHSRLRHDLIGPLGRILGYSELLIEDARAKGRSFRAQVLGSILALGKEALEAIDRALIHDRPRDRPTDLASLAPGVITPSNAIIRACQTLEDASGQVPDRLEFLDDLAMIRQDSALLIEMVRDATAEIARVSG